MQKRLSAIGLAVLLLSSWIVPIAHTGELKIEKTLTAADGLVSNTVLTIFEDSHGTMWFGTTDGLTRYDGENFRTFTTENGLSRNPIGLIFEDRQSTLWFADGMLPSLLERGKPMDMSYMAMPLSELAKEIDNETPTETETPAPLRGVSRYNGQAFRILTTDDGLLRDTIKDIFEDKTGTLWLATFSGVNYYDGEKFYPLIIHGPIGMEILPDWWSQVTAIAQDTAGNFWFGSTAGITYYNTETAHFRHFAVDPDLVPFEEMAKAGSVHITDLQFDTKENLWMSREGNDKTLLMTHNQGKHWEIITGSDLKAVSFITKRKGWAAGRGGIILSTTDGGFTWTSQASSIHQTLYDILALSEQEIYAVGAAGTIIHSTDGGETWEQEHTGINDNLYAVTRVKGSDTLWAVGQLGVVLRRPKR